MPFVNAVVLPCQCIGSWVFGLHISSPLIRKSLKELPRASIVHKDRLNVVRERAKEGFRVHQSMHVAFSHYPVLRVVISHSAEYERRSTAQEHADLIARFCYLRPETYVPFICCEKGAAFAKIPGIVKIFGSTAAWSQIGLGLLPRL